MQDLTPEQQKRLLRLAEIIDGGEVAVAKEITTLEDRLDALPAPEKGEKGDRGRDGVDGKSGQDGANGRDGRDGVDGRDGKDGKDGRDGKDGERGEQGSPDTADQVRDKLESLKEDDRLDVSAIKGLGNRDKKLTDDLINRAIGIVDQRTSFLINKVSNLSDRVDRVGSSGLSTVAHDATLTGDGTVGSPLSVTITGGYTKETPTGTVDGSNVTFTVTATPEYIVSDGITLFDGAGYTIATLTLTLDNPPSQFIRSFY